MITINLRDKNRIVLLDCIGKAPIRGRTSHSPYFHTSLELLQASIGLCIGGNILEFCRFNNLNANIFEEIIVTDESHSWTIIIKKPKDLDKLLQDRLERQICNCNISKELVKQVKVQWEDNKISTEDLVKELPKSCCGS